ncbi:MFS transporter [Tumebacillus lipolyticus]|uniref:MFS transporter n=1 Tax=Tumebacillus lipolyticus TaxID=1280370 RepID=A0ABW4ZUF6_9BACL
MSASYSDLLKNRNYRLLFSGQLLSQLGDAIYEVGIVWLVYRMTGSPAAIGMLVLCQTVPFLVLGLIAGAFADRWNRRLTMIVTDALRGAAMLYLVLRYLAGGLTLWEVCLVAVVLTSARAFFHPSLRAVLPQIVRREELLLANSLSESAKRICKVGGMLLGGVLMAAEQVEWMLWINCISFFLSLWTVWQIALKRAERAEHAERSERSDQTIFADLLMAGKEIRKERAVTFSILLSSLGLVASAGMIKVGLPLLAGERLGGEGDTYGLLMACFSVGMFASAALMKKLARLHILTMVGIGWSVYGIMFGLLALSPQLLIACLAVGIIGCAHFLTDIPVTTIIQQKMPLGRMSSCQSIWATASFGSESIGVAIAGPVLASLSVTACFALGGGAMVALGLLPLIILRKSGQNKLDRRTCAE